MSEPKKKSEAPDVIALPAGPVDVPAAQPKAPRRMFACTRLPAPRVLGAAELARMSPTARATHDSAAAHHQQWGHLPPQVAQHLRGVELTPLAVEVHARESGTDPVHFAAARAFHRWALGQEMSRGDYDAAVERVLSEPHGR